MSGYPTGARHVSKYLADKIVKIVAERQRHVCAGQGVLPKTVGAYLRIARCEQTLRADMAQMAAEGLLMRVGGDKGRRGYRVPAPKPMLMPSAFIITPPPLVVRVA